MTKKSQFNQEKNWEEILERSENLSAEDDEDQADQINPTSHDQKKAALNPDKKQLSHPSYEELEAQLTAAEEKAQENWNKFMRSQAELENQSRRAEREVLNAHKFAVRDLAKNLLEIGDNLERSLEFKANVSTADDAYNHLRSGVELTLKIFQTCLEKFNVRAVNPINQPFDPNYHEAMSTEVNPDVAPQTVLKVLQKGYLLHERLIRPALVVVSKAAN